jgi:hypothetical protein
MKKDLPKEFIDFAKKNCDKYSYWDLRVILFKEYNIEMSESYLIQLLKANGFKTKYKPKKVHPLYYKGGKIF